MARPLRLECEGAFYHITARGNERKNIFLSAADYERFFSGLSDGIRKYGIVLHCYVLMSNHYHLLVETPMGLLSRFMHDLGSGYTTYFNVKRKRAGHLFQGRFKSILIDKDSYLLELSRYIHLNPVRAHIVKKPEDYPYSSYPAYIFPVKETIVTRDLIWGMAASDRSTAPEQYRRFVENALEDTSNPFKAVYGGVILGSTAFIEETLKKVDNQSIQSHETARKRMLIALPSDLESIIALLTSYYGISGETAKTSSPYRGYAVYLARKHTSLSNRDIGEYFGISTSGVTKIVTRISRRIEGDAETERELHSLSNEISRK